MKKQNVRTLSLIVCTFTYLLVGAAVFDALESTTEKNRFEVLQGCHLTVGGFKVSCDAGEGTGKLEHLVYEFSITHTISVTPGTWSEPSGGGGRSRPAARSSRMHALSDSRVDPPGDISFFSTTAVINCYVPFSVIIKSIKRAMNCAQTNASEVDLICVVTILSSLTIAGGAAAFSKFEGWSYFDSVYYCFITLTTIGFGDMVALQKDNALNRKPSYVMFALIFILFGLAIVAACLNLLVLRFVTMNTEDEKRDQAQAEQAQQVAVRLEGDVITADGAVLRGVARGTRLPAPHALITAGDPSMTPLYIDDEYSPSVCSCSCSCFRKTMGIPYRDPLSPVPPTYIKDIRSKNYRELGNMPRHSEKTSGNRSQSLRLNSASGYLYMNAKSNDFQIDPEDFRDIVAKRREQLRKGMTNMSEQYTHAHRDSCRTESQSSLYSMNIRNDNRSNDPLVYDCDSERSSYERKKIIKNIERNTDRRNENYFYDDAILHFDDEYAFDGSIIFAKRRKSVDRNIDLTCELPSAVYDQLSNDSYGYYLPDDEDEDLYFVNDTLTFNLPPHRASI
nr:potassium channel subfamily K member 9-like [Danaus plexippus plexippus]